MNQLVLSQVAIASSEGAEFLHIAGIEFPSELITMWILMAVLVILSIVGTRNMQRIPKGLQNLLEYGVSALENFFADLMGVKRARKYLPFLMTFFLFILISNYSGLLPMAGHLPGLKPPTSNVNVTGTLAVIVALSLFYFGIREKGMGYFKHFISPVPVLLPINILETFTRPLSLALRLFGNIYGEEMVVAVLLGLMPILLPLPIQVLGVLFGAVQAFVFTLLAAIYIEEATAHEH